MAKEWAKAFYNSKAWEECRVAYIQSCHGLCERCHDVGYILHHKTHLTPNNINDPYVTLGWENLEYLCKKCHDHEHNFGRKKTQSTKDGYIFNDKGELVPIPPH
ncbi:HNH endonuclease [Vallitalea pronyensis]|uniref:HNH endonuclease n=1 Tax=Vallitalea pronyensis TaxID=1348613 RepID=UPI0038CDA408